ncbi:MAG: hypothetical protein KF770_11270 [Anaerolineae bacterium]|nr:hypothetical protein [Anaerolineae bacterium]
MNTQDNTALWLRWVGANSLAEAMGLGLTFALDVLIIWQVMAAGSAWASLVGILLMSATGAIEGGVVGWLQWLVLRRPFPHIARRAWIRATIIGAVVAWFLGSLPSTLMDMGAADADTAVAEPALAIVLLLAAGMGLVLGLVLAFPQWRVLRTAVPHAWVWLPANAAAWAVGMPLIFALIDLAQRSSSTAVIILTIFVGLFITGAVVGAVHGLALVWLARPLSAAEDLQTWPLIG